MDNAEHRLGEIEDQLTAKQTKFLELDELNLTLTLIHSHTLVWISAFVNWEKEFSLMKQEDTIQILMDQRCKFQAGG